VYRGQCAEFCGYQHAHMAFTVVAESRADYDAWYEAQLGTALPAAAGLASTGQDVFLAKACPLCHTIRGTDASGRTGPELTHLASRKRIAASTLPNDDGALRAWILDPHAFKPGVRMPQNPLTSDEVDALVAYLRGLQ
jgi:cytochrome c oxidase subunit 2